MFFRVLGQISKPKFGTPYQTWRYYRHHTVKTTLPNLSYKPKGCIWSDDMHATAVDKHPTYSRTDLAHFDRWNTFPVDIHQAITDRMMAMNITKGTTYDIGPVPNMRPVIACEADVQNLAQFQLHDVAILALKKLGIEGRFARTAGGNMQIIGAPDFSWLPKSAVHPRLMVRACCMYLINTQPGTTGRVQDKMGCTPRRLTCLFSMVYFTQGSEPTRGFARGSM